MTWKDILKAKKPDFIDLDGDGNTTEPMSEAAKDVEKQTGKGLESIAHDEQDLKYLMSLNPQKLKQVLEARKRVSQGIPSDAGQRPRIPQFKKILKGYKDDTEELRERGLISGYDPKDVIEWDKGYEDRQIKRMLTTIRRWVENFHMWESKAEHNPIRFRKYGNRLYWDYGPDSTLGSGPYAGKNQDDGYVGIYYEINNFFKDLESGKKGQLLIGTMEHGKLVDFKDSPIEANPLELFNFELNPKLKNNPMKYKNEISQLYRDLTLEQLMRNI